MASAVIYGNGDDLFENLRVAVSGNFDDILTCVAVRREEDRDQDFIGKGIAGPIANEAVMNSVR